MNFRSQWILMRPETGTIGLASPELEPIKGGGWILYSWDQIKDKLICSYFGGNLTSYKKEGWIVVGKL